MTIYRGETNRQRFQDWLPTWAKSSRNEYRYDFAESPFQEISSVKTGGVWDKHLEGLHPVTKEPIHPFCEVKVLTEPISHVEEEELELKRREGVMETDWKDGFAKAEELIKEACLLQEDFRREKEEVMTARLWIEFGKMWNNLECAGWTIDLNSILDEDSGCDCMEYSITLSNVAAQSFGKWLTTPYAALKDVYFRNYLGIDDFVEEMFQLDDDVLENLEDSADRDGITIDEVVDKVLREVLESLGSLKKDK